MSNIKNGFLDFFENYISIIRISDIIDILLVAYLIYQLFRIVSGTKAEQILKGIIILLVITLASNFLKLNSINFILSNTLQAGFIALIVLFQPELRKALEKVGRNTFGNVLKSDSEEGIDVSETIHQVCNAAKSFSVSRTGAIIVFERETNLNELLIGTYSPVDSLVTSSLLHNIFYPNTPLHDGAVIIRNNRVYAANCYLPLTSRDGIDQEMGTRHRAGIGITELSDCVSVMVSEETGKISVAVEGKIERGLTTEALEIKLKNLLLAPQPTVEKKKWKKGRVRSK